ncbi:MAG: hypothetical protein Q4Q17_05580, partial [Tissierellia bacterium]|nr:hypothetical protein [Tissierellia bacterium]
INIGALFMLKIYGVSLWEQNIPFAMELIVGTFLAYYLHEKFRFGNMTAVIMDCYLEGLRTL